MGPPAASAATPLTVAAAGAAIGRPALTRLYAPGQVDAAAGASITDAVILTSSPTARSALEGAGWRPLAATVPPMTDDFMDVLRFLRPLW